MELKDGYKQTDVGDIPNDWNVIKLGNVADITKLAGFEYTNYFNSYKDGGDIIVLRGTNITHNKLDLTDVRTIPRSTSNKLPRSKLSRDDLVFAYVGTIGPVFLVDKDETYHLGPNTSKITARNGIAPEFLFAYFNSWLIKNEIVEHTSTGAQPSLSMTKIRNFRIISPPSINEQTAIANVLSNTDSLIDKLNQLIAKKQNIKLGTMQELLAGKKRLKGFSGEWEVKKLEKVISFVVDNRGKTPPLSKEGKPLIEVNTIYRQGKSPNYNLVTKYVNQLTYENWFRDGHPKKGDILVVTVGSAGVSSYVKEEKGCIAQNIISLRIDKNYSSEYVYYYTLTRSFQDQVKSVLMGAVQPSLKVPHLKAFDICLSKKIEEQAAIATILSDVDAEIEQLEQQLHKYKLIKQGMMQELLTGKTRLI